MRRAPSLPGPEPGDLREQLRAVERWLAPAHENLIGVGIGRRRRRGRLTSETVVRFIVTEGTKPRKGGRLKRGLRRLPDYVPMWGEVYGQPAQVMVPTDVETVRPVEVAMPRMGTGYATALASWRDRNGDTAYGAVTAGHCLVEVGGDEFIQGPGGVDVPVTVVAKTEVEDDAGLDVGLARLKDPSAELLDAGPETFPLATAEQLTQLLGPSPVGDGRSAPAYFWTTEDNTTEIEGVAYYSAYPFQVAGHERVIARDVIECNAAAGTFKVGQSGSAWAILGTGGSGIAIAIQSHISVDGRRGFGTHLASGFEWLKGRRKFPELQLVWTAAELDEDGDG
ncbi:MAG: hypothetical protein ACYTGP_11940 [Planctomycetota bacterium]|jgi:hypothetical protein